MNTPTRWKHYERFALLAVLLIVVMCLFPYPRSSFSWWEDHAVEWTLGLLFGGLFFLIINQPRLMFITFAGCAALSYFLYLRTYGSLKPAEQNRDSQSLKVATFHFPVDAAAEDSTLHDLLRSNADVLVLQDIPTDRLPGIHPLLQEHGYINYQIESYEGTARELGVYSRREIAFRRFFSNEEGGPCLSGYFKLPFLDSLQALLVVCVTLSPANETPEKAGTMLKALATRLRQTPTPVLVVGNFNLVSWAREIQEFKEETRLQDSQRGLGPVFPPENRNLFQGPLDHIFYSPHFKCINFKAICSGRAPYVGMVGTYQLVNESRSNATQTSQEL